LAEQIWVTPLNSTFRSLLFPEKEAKSVSSASQKIIGYLILREAEPRGLGLAPEAHYAGQIGIITLNSTHRFLLFPEKEAKSVSSASQKTSPTVGRL
jgi:hypothetical protein